MPTVIDLGVLGTQGFIVQGDAAEDQSAFSVSEAGDVNGDGFDDIILGAPYNDAGGTRAGAAYVIFGHAGGFGTVDLSNLQPSQGFRIQGDAEFDTAGRSVAAVGDVNGDGFDDIVIASSDGAGWYYVGTPRAYVIFGKSTAFSTIDLTSLSASDGFIINGPSTYGYNPIVVAGHGDINGDGFDDILLGFRYTNTSYVIFGKASGLGAIDLASLSPTAGFALTGTSYEAAGISLSFAGDLNGDGFDDLIIGAPYSDVSANEAGAAYVVFGRSGPFGTVDLSTLHLTPSVGFVIRGDAAQDLAGFRVSAAGDVNGDGFDDVILSAPGGDGGGDLAGEAYVIFGHSGGFGTINLATLAAGAGFLIVGDSPNQGGSFSVSGAGDVNRDGFDDVIVGAPAGGLGGEAAGQVYVIFGHFGAFGTIDLANLASSAGFVVQGDLAGDLTGWAVSAAGDLNGDGFADIIVGAPFGDDGGASAGEAYVIFGDGANAPAGRAGDFNGDGRDDILWRHDSGALTSWMGQANGGFVASANANAGDDWHVAGIGDFNNDGSDDILWRNANGDVTNWLAQSSSFVSNFGNAYYQVDNRWQVDGTGDFNGDGRDDILWRHDNGAVSNWLGQANGGFVSNTDADAGIDWQVAGVGDFNGDGRDDVLWRNLSGSMTNWLAQPNGSFASNFGNAYYQVDNSWQVAGVGDFNGDGRDDILWRHGSGAVISWLGQPNGGFASNSNANAGTDWQVASIGDFNGDGRDDILWRHDGGAVTNWLGQANGSFVSNFENAYYALDQSWHVQPEPNFVF